MVYATSKGSDQPAHTHSLIRAFASGLIKSSPTDRTSYSSPTDRTSFGVHKLQGRLHRLVQVYTCQNATLLEITCCIYIRKHKRVQVGTYRILSNQGLGENVLNAQTCHILLSSNTQCTVFMYTEMTPTEFEVS